MEENKSILHELYVFSEWKPEPEYIPFIVQMVISPDSSKLVCLHCNGDVSAWRLPLLKPLQRWRLTSQPGFDLRNPLVGEQKDAAAYQPGDEIILSRFSGAVSVCDLENMVTCAHGGTFMVLECESNVLPAKKARSDESSVLFAITDMEAFQPRPRRVTVVSRVYRLLGVRSTTPEDLFSRKIESGNYAEALSLAETFSLDSDLVYQQQWRKNPVSTDAIQKYLSKVSKKIWAVHQCVDRLPETLPAANQLLHFGLTLTTTEILQGNCALTPDSWAL
ncbi:hypothetical protein MSG28_010669 [Choristoneura fumiferana]|uniref:Uncharacterized protein n=1 Tax=Choristoneura fumiferana TaxID=7141 RepID=A0ACC0KNI2_CHOFU|nr:hypothetical protein MSG28_010669 [Choristoneura fumiferana]